MNKKITRISINVLLGLCTLSGYAQEDTLKLSSETYSFYKKGLVLPIFSALSCQGLRLAAKEGYDPRKIQVVAMKYKAEKTKDQYSKEVRGTAKLSDLPLYGVKFDGASYIGTYRYGKLTGYDHYRIFAYPIDNDGQVDINQEPLDAERVFKVSLSPKKLCLQNNLPYEPLFLKHSVNNADLTKIGLAVGALIVVSAGAYAYKKSRDNKNAAEQEIKYNTDLANYRLEQNKKKLGENLGTEIKTFNQALKEQAEEEESQKWAPARNPNPADTLPSPNALGVPGSTILPQGTVAVSEHVAAELAKTRQRDEELQANYAREQKAREERDKTREQQEIDRTEAQALRDQARLERENKEKEQALKIEQWQTEQLEKRRNQIAENERREAEKREKTKQEVALAHKRLADIETAKAKVQAEQDKEKAEAQTNYDI